MGKILVVDGHCHPPRKPPGYYDKHPEELPRTKEQVETAFDEQLEGLISQMDRDGIDVKALIEMPPDIEGQFNFGRTLPDTDIKTPTTREWILKARKLYPERFVGFVCLNPLESDSISKLEQAVIEQHFLAAKIHQAHYGFEVNDRRVYPFYEKCVELNIPVAFHTGYSPVRNIDRLIPTNPLLLDELAYDMPELRIIMCHTGGNWYQEGIMVALRNENVAVDISGLPQLLRFIADSAFDPKKLIYRIVELLGADRVFYGTDNKDAFNLTYMQDVGLSESDLRKVMGLSFAKYFRIDSLLSCQR